MESMKAGFAVALAVSATLAFAQTPAPQPAAPATAPAAPAAAPAAPMATKKMPTHVGKPVPVVLDAATAADVTTYTAKVVAVSYSKRTITVVGPMGKEVTFNVGPQIHNLNQVRRGDKLVIKYLEAVSVSLDTNIVGRSKTVTTSVPVSAPAGDKPGVAQARQTVIVAAVDSVDTATNHILVHGPEGRYVEVKVKDPAIMKTVKAGDKIVLTYTEAVMVDWKPTK
jgi:hypothetical protein